MGLGRKRARPVRFQDSGFLESLCHALSSLDKIWLSTKATKKPTA
jgi:hypothetical protein